MKLLVDVKDKKAAFIIEVLNNFSYVKTEPLTPYKESVLVALRDSIREFNLIRKGKLKGIPAKNILDEL